MDEIPDMFSDLHQTARAWFTSKLVNGEIPETIKGGELDGVPYFRVTLGGGDTADYYLTEIGLFTSSLQDRFT